MCGRIAHFRSEESYLAWLASQLPASGPISSEPADRYNVAPHSSVSVLHLEDQNLQFRGMRWGYSPPWANARAPAINARLDKVSSSPYWSQIWPGGRCLVPADGWYEWLGDPRTPRARQPWFIHLVADEPMFMAAIAPLSGTAEVKGGQGFAILTTESEGGMIDVHDRRPVVLPPDAAREWLQPSLVPERAIDLLRYHCMPVDAFHWYPVGPAVGNVRSEGRHLIEPVAPAPTTGDLFGDPS